MSAATQNAPAVGGGTTKHVKAAADIPIKSKKWAAPPEQATKGSKKWSGAKHKFLAKKDHTISDEAKKGLRKSRKIAKKSLETRSEYFRKSREGGRKSQKETKAERVKALKDEAEAQKENKRLRTVERAPHAFTGTKERPPVLKTAGKGKTGRPVKAAVKNCDVIYEVGSKTKYDKTNRSKQFKEYRKKAFKELKSKAVPKVASAAHAVHYELLFHVGKNQRYQKRSCTFREFRKKHSGANKKDIGVKVIYEVGKAAVKA